MPDNEVTARNNTPRSTAPAVDAVDTVRSSGSPVPVGEVYGPPMKPAKPINPVPPTAPTLSTTLGAHSAVRSVASGDPVEAIVKAAPDHSKIVVNSSENREAALAAIAALGKKGITVAVNKRQPVPALFRTPFQKTP